MIQGTDSGPRLWGFPALPLLSVTSDLWLNLFVPHFLICIVMGTEPTSLSEEEFSEAATQILTLEPGTWCALHGVWIDSGRADGGE